MIRIELSGLKAAIARVDSLGKQVRFAASRTLNVLAQQHVIPALRHEIRDSIDRPTPYTLNSMRQGLPASRSRLETSIGFKRPGDSDKVLDADRDRRHYLSPHVHGGPRDLKRYERRLRSAGVLPDGYFTVAGDGAKLDAYGNVSRGEITKLLSYFGGALDTGFTSHVSARRKFKLAQGTRNKWGLRYFVGRPNEGKAGSRAPLGIYQVNRIGRYWTNPRPILIFVRSTNYQRRLALDDAAQFAVERHAATVFRAELAAAQASAR